MKQVNIQYGIKYFLSLLTLFDRLLHSKLIIKMMSNSKLWIKIRDQMTLLVKENSLSVKFYLLLLSMAGYNSPLMKRRSVNFLSGLTFPMINPQYQDNNNKDLKFSQFSLYLSHLQDVGLPNWETNSQYHKVMLLVIKHNFSNQCNQITKGCHQDYPKGSLHHSFRGKGLIHKVFINHLLDIIEIKLICIKFN